MSLGIAVASFTTAVIALVVEYETSVVVFRGTYSVLAGTFCAGYVGWVVGASKREVRRDVARLTAALIAVRDQVASGRVVHLPTQRKPGEGQRFVAAAVGSQIHTVPLGPYRTGLDAETIAAARSLAKRIIDGPTDDVPTTRDSE